MLKVLGWEEGGPVILRQDGYKMVLSDSEWETAEKEAAERPTTVKVKIAAAVDKYGDWHALGFKGGDEEANMGIATENVSAGANCFWVEADLPLPQTETVAGSVTEDV